MSDNAEEQIGTRSDEEPLHIALTETDEDVAWKAIAVLHQRGGPRAGQRCYRASRGRA